MTAHLGKLDLPRWGSNIVHHVLKAVDYSIEPIIREMAHETINKNPYDEIILALKHNFDLGENLTEY